MAAVCPVAPLHQEANPSLLKIRSVKTPAGSPNLTPIPSHHALTTSTSNDQAVIHPGHDDSIPVIDFSLLSSSDPDQRSKVVLDLAKACEEWGFFMVINHGVPESQMKAMVDMLTEFFDLTEEEKSEFEGKNVLDPIRCGTKFNASGDKVFSRRDFLNVRLHPEFHSPSKPEGFRYPLSPSLFAKPVGAIPSKKESDLAVWMMVKNLRPHQKEVAHYALESQEI